MPVDVETYDVEQVPVDGDIDHGQSSSDNMERNGTISNHIPGTSMKNSRIGVVTRLASFNNPGLRESTDPVLYATESGPGQRRSTRKKSRAKDYNAFTGKWEDKLP